MKYLFTYETNSINFNGGLYYFYTGSHLIYFNLLFTNDCTIIDYGNATFDRYQRQPQVKVLDFPGSEIHGNFN